MDSFVYRWREIATGKWYIGYHKGQPDDGYICSSQIVKPLIQTDPSRWERKILRFGTRQACMALERRLLKKLEAKKNPKSYNRSNGSAPGCPSILELIGFNPNISTAQEIAVNYKSILDSKDYDKLLILDLWMIKKVMN